MLKTSSIRLRTILEPAITMDGITFFLHSIVDKFAILYMSHVNVKLRSNPTVDGRILFSYSKKYKF